jgi:hypothetical protein
MSPTETSILDQLLDPIGRCLTPEVAGQIADLRASVQIQERLEILADRCTEGQLTADEKTEYEAYVQAMNFMAILQAKARAILTEVTSS